LDLTFRNQNLKTHAPNLSERGLPAKNKAPNLLRKRPSPGATLLN
jgi:hypothetical protein